MTKDQRKEFVNSVLAFLVELSVEGRGQRAGVAPSPTQPKTPQAVAGASLDSHITVIKGIGTDLAAKFEKLGVRTVRDLLYFFPNRHLDYSQRKPISQLVEGKEETIVANVWEARETRPGGRRSTEATVGDETGNVRVIWFNNPYMVRQLHTNSRVVISGKV
ncbi:MAG: DNA helicase RecG, partial [Chloroflexi bacterium]|nr:DNA helicase RecG [Chloroflexota bacterium]